MLNDLDTIIQQHLANDKCNTANIIGREVRDECVGPSCPLVDQVRQTRLKWLGHVLRAGEENLVRAAVVKMCTEQ